MLRPLLYFLTVGIVCLLFSCNKEKQKAPDVSFFVISNAKVVTTPDKGAGSHKITDIWYYVDGQFLGAYPVGKIMPIVASKNADIVMYAGIKNNGISETRLPYKFYTSYNLSNFSLEQGKTYTISPTFEYVNYATIRVFDSFDSSIGSNFKSIGDSSYFLTADPSKTKGGTGKSVYMSMTDAKSTAMMVSSIPLSGLPTTGGAVYLELDYKCNQAITVGVIGGGADVRTAITLNPTSDWNTIYIQLSAVLTTPPTSSSHELFIKAVKSVDSPEIFIDNVKLVY